MSVDKLLWSTFDNINLTDLQKMANTYKGKSVNDLNKIFIARCKKDDRENPQCKYDVDILSNVVYNISKINPPPVIPPAKPKPIDYSKLPSKLRAKLEQQQQQPPPVPERSQQSLDFSKQLRQQQPPPVPERSQKTLDFSKQRRGIEPRKFDEAVQRPIKSDVLSINTQLETLVQRITRDKASALGQKVPELMKTQLQLVKKELNDYIKLLSNSYNELKRKSPNLLSKYKQLNSEYIILNKYINTYDDFLNSLIKLKNLIPSFLSNPDKKINDVVREYQKIIQINNSLPGPYRIMGYIDKTPLETLYSMKQFTDNKNVQNLHKKYKIMISR